MRVRGSDVSGSRGSSWRGDSCSSVCCMERRCTCMHCTKVGNKEQNLVNQQRKIHEIMNRDTQNKERTRYSFNYPPTSSQASSTSYLSCPSSSRLGHGALSTMLQSNCVSRTSCVRIRIHCRSHNHIRIDDGPHMVQPHP